MIALLVRSRMRVQIQLTASLAIALLAFGCKPDPRECLEKGDEKACQALCSTGKPELDATCYETRARAVVACVDGKTDCTEPCKSWGNAQLSGEDVRNYYVAKLGSPARVALVTKKCGGGK